MVSLSLQEGISLEAGDEGRTQDIAGTEQSGLKTQKAPNGDSASPGGESPLSFFSFLCTLLEGAPSPHSSSPSPLNMLFSVAEATSQPLPLPSLSLGLPHRASLEQPQLSHFPTQLIPAAESKRNAHNWPAECLMPEEL